MKYTILFIALAVSFCSCRKEHKNFNEQIIVDPLVSLAGKEFVLNCKTERIYASAGTIVGSVKRDGNNITIDFKDVLFSHGYAGHSSKAQAACQLQIGELSNGDYSLTIYNGNKQSTGTLTVTNDEYSLFFYMLNDITIAHYRFLKVPDNTIWGDINYLDAAQKTIADIFTDSLEYYGAKPFTPQPGEYLYFNSKAGNITLGDASVSYQIGVPFTNQKTFIYSYSGSNEKIHNLINNYGMKQDSVMFRIWRSNGYFYQFPMPAVATVK